MEINGLGKIFLMIAVTALLTACSDEQLYVDDLRRIAKDVNEKCPRMVDSETRLDGLEVREPNTLVYQYTLVNVHLMPADTHQFFQSLWPGLISFVKLNKEMSKLRDNGTSIYYEYKDKSDKVVYTIKIRPEDYTKP
jgi:hypothetical protein